MKLNVRQFIIYFYFTKGLHLIGILVKIRDDKNICARRYLRIKSTADSYYPWVFIIRG